MNRESPLEKPTVACLRCRDQKLKCDRELPSCVRCRKQRAACKYPTPRDRKPNAQKSSQAKASALASISLSDGVDVEPVHPSEFSTAPKTGKRQRIGISNTEHSYDCTTNLNTNPDETEAAGLPSTEVGLLLLEVYFKRVYNATLLFHKTIAFQLYRQNGIPGYLLRAIFAHAAIFLEQVDSPYKKYIKIFPVHTLFEKSWSWARSASREVLSHADEPTLARIQALQVLQFYYFSRGDTHRTIIHASLAYRLSQLLGYDRLHENIASPTSRSLQFDHEMKRRCFWASWCSLCIGSRHLDVSIAYESVKGLPLPSIFERGGSMHGVEIKLGQNMEVDGKSSTQPLPPSHGITGSSSCSLLAEMVKLMGMWTKVQAFISETTVRSKSQRIIQLNSLVELFDSIESSLHLPFPDLCSRAKFYDESPELLMSVCSVHYLSRLLMHASMVPFLSGNPAESPDLKESAGKNVKVALQQATLFAELLQQFVAKDLDITRLWPFIGYGAFVAGSVFVEYKHTMQSDRLAGISIHVPGLESENMKTVVTVLEVLSIYWKPLRRLAIKLQKSIEARRSSDVNPITSSTYPWETHHHGFFFEDHCDTTDIQKNSHPNIPLLRTPYITWHSESQLVHQQYRHENSQDSCQIHREQHVSAEELSRTENILPPAPDSGYQSAPEDGFLSSNEGGIFDVDWWDIVPAVNGWESSPLVEMPLGDSLL